MQDQFNTVASVMEIFEDGTKRWFRNGELHREDGPAVELEDGSKMWYRNNEWHREDGPAIEDAGDGSKSWFLNGQLHREDGPAIEYADGSSSGWFRNGMLLNDSEVAVIQEVASIKQGLPHAITVSRPLRLRLRKN